MSQEIEGLQTSIQQTVTKNLKDYIKDFNDQLKTLDSQYKEHELRH